MRLLLATLTGLGLFLSYPPAAVSPVAFVALVPLLVALDRAPRRAAFWLGTLAGMVFYPLNLSWASHAMRGYGGLSGGPILLLLLLLSFSLALCLGAFSACWVWLKPASGVGQILLAGSLWGTLGFARSYFLTGFAWSFLASPQSP